SAGFTLVEVLIALTLTVVMSGLLVSALHTFAKSSAVGQAHLEAQQQRESVRHFLRQQLSGMVPLFFGSAAERVILFFADHEKIVFVGGVPSHRAPGGLHKNVLFREGRSPEQKLQYAYKRLVVDEAFDGEGFKSIDDEMDVRTLASHAEAIEFDYFGAIEADAETQWHDEWRGPNRLPELIRIRIEAGDDGHIDELIVPVYANSPSGHVALSITGERAATPFSAPAPGADPRQPTPAVGQQR
ncbi:MAG: hypothetical protein ACU85U_12905, partial [Gammaproteobacteria bacterium]